METQAGASDLCVGEWIPKAGKQIAPAGWVCTGRAAKGADPAIGFKKWPPGRAVITIIHFWESAVD